MCRYYFHVKRGQLTRLDHEGVELLDFADAKDEASRRAQAILAKEGRAATATYRAIIIEDDWHTLLEVQF